MSFMSIKKPLIFILSAMLLFSAYRIFNPINELSEKIIKLLESYTNEVPEEKVFLHLDRHNYAAGDYIWFSAYLTAGSPDVPSPLSKVLYVDLLDNEGKLLLQQTVKIENGHGHGSFRLDPFLREGTYHIKAYSYWMKGFGEDAVYTSAIEVLEPYNLSFQPSVTFEKRENGNTVSYLAKISAMDRSMQAMANQKLTYELANKTGILKKGEFTTNAEGTFDLKWDMEAQSLNQPTALVLNFEENESYSISRKFLLPFPSQSLDIQFLPEGGDLIVGFPNKIAIKAMYPDGSPIALTGSIAAQGENLSFSTGEHGMGLITFTPEAGQNYVAQIKLGEQTLSKTLPKVQTQGINLTVDNSREGLVNVLVQSKDFNQISPSGDALLVVHARGRIGHMQRINLNAGVTGARINKAQLSSGINQITVFEPQGNPLAERLIFIPQDKALKMTLEANTVNVQPRGKNQWNLQMEGEGFEGGFFSISITDANEMPYNPSSNILSYLKLESELRGSIPQAKDFLGSSINEEGIDLILLTNGWRRFSWDKVFAEKFDNPNFIEQGINITGVVSPKENTKRALGGGSINFMTKGGEDYFIKTEYPENGRFIIDNLDFQDTTQITLTISDRRFKDFVSLKLDPPLAKYVQWEGFNPAFNTYAMNPVYRDYLEKAAKRRQVAAAFGEEKTVELGEFVLKSQKIDPLDDQINRVFGRGDVVLKPQEIPGAEAYADIWSLLQGRFAGVRIAPNPLGSPTITIRGSGSFNNLSPLILLDNVPVDPLVLNGVSPRDLASVEVFKDGASLAIFGSAGAGGAIAFYTRRGNGMASMSDGTFNLMFPGYSVTREFYMPKYDKENNPAPDFRSTLYWNPALKWAGNRAAIEFFNNDQVQKFKVVIQGMDKFGRLAYLEQEVTP